MTASQCSRRARPTAHDLPGLPDPTPAVKEAPTIATAGTPCPLCSSFCSQPARGPFGRPDSPADAGRRKACEYVDPGCGMTQGAQGPWIAPCAGVTGASARQLTAATAAAIATEHRRITAQSQLCRRSCQTNRQPGGRYLARTQPAFSEPPATNGPALTQSGPLFLARSEE